MNWDTDLKLGPWSSEDGERPCSCLPYRGPCAEAFHVVTSLAFETPVSEMLKVLF